MKHPRTVRLGLRHITCFRMYSFARTTPYHPCHIRFFITNVDIAHKQLCILWLLGCTHFDVEQKTAILETSGFPLQLVLPMSNLWHWINERYCFEDRRMMLKFLELGAIGNTVALSLLWYLRGIRSELIIDIDFMRAAT